MPRAASSGKKVEIVPLDNKTNPQESLIQAQKAIDSGIRFLTQGNGSSVAGALSDFVTKYNERNPGKEVALLQLCRGRSGPDQRQVQFLAFPLGCEFRHQDGSADQLHEGRSGDQESLSDQSGLFVRRIGARRSQNDACREAAGYPDRRRRVASAAEDHRLLALHCQDQGIRCRHAWSPATGGRTSRCC